METKFNFKSQIATDKNQSERLLALGLKPETSDCMHYHCWTPEDGIVDDIPAWSLDRLIEMMPNDIGMGEECYITQVVLCKRIFAYMDFGSIEYMFGEKDNSYDNAINCIEWLIKEGYFNKKYLTR